MRAFSLLCVSAVAGVPRHHGRHKSLHGAEFQSAWRSLKALDLLVEAPSKTHQEFAPRLPAPAPAVYELERKGKGKGKGRSRGDKMIAMASEKLATLQSNADMSDFSGAGSLSNEVQLCRELPIVAVECISKQVGPILQQQYKKMAKAANNESQPIDEGADLLAQMAFDMGKALAERCAAKPIMYKVYENDGNKLALFAGTGETQRWFGMEKGSDAVKYFDERMQANDEEMYPVNILSLIHI